MGIRNVSGDVQCDRDDAMTLRSRDLWRGIIPPNATDRKHGHSMLNNIALHVLSVNMLAIVEMRMCVHIGFRGDIPIKRPPHLASRIDQCIKQHTTPANSSNDADALWCGNRLSK